MALAQCTLERNYANCTTLTRRVTLYVTAPRSVLPLRTALDSSGLARQCPAQHGTRRAKPVESVAAAIGNATLYPLSDAANGTV